MRPLIILWPLVAFLVISVANGASVSSRDSTYSMETPKESKDDGEATIEDADHQHFFYHNAAGSNDKESAKEDESHKDEVEADSLEPSMAELKNMLHEVMEEVGYHERVPRNTFDHYPIKLPQFWSPVTGTAIGVTLPGWRSPYRTRLVPIDDPINHEILNKLDGDEEQTDEAEDVEGCKPCKCKDEFTIPDGFVFDPTIAHDEGAGHDEADEHRSKRSADDDYWYTLKDPSKHLEKNDVYFSIRNDLRRRVEKNARPLHDGHIYTGNIGNPYDYDIHDRPFGHDADFNFPYDMHAFKWKPHGPRLNKKWKHHEFPIYSHNLYKLREPVTAAKFDKNGQGANVVIKGGVYKFTSVTKTGGLLLTNVKTHNRFFIPKFFQKLSVSKKFQALAPWKDPNGLYFPVLAHKLGGKAYIIKGTPLTGNDPKKGNHLVYHGFSDDLHPAPPGHVLNREKSKPSPDIEPHH